MSTHQLAVGQFDLAATANTERGSRLLLEGGRDLFPLPDDNSKAERVIDKYNRHWAMVLNPDEATAGCDLHQIARRSVQQVGGSSEEDAQVGGGVTDEMRRLVGFASADADHADHVHGRGTGSDDVDDDALFDELTLHNIEGYSGTIQTGASSEEAIQEASQRRALFSKSLMDKLRIATTSSTNSTPLASSIFPNPQLGRELLSALTRKMEADARTDADAIRLAHGLPEQFLEDLSKYFRRTCELLRHFFGLRQQLEGGQQKQKLHKIVGGMEVVYRKMEAMRKELPQSEAGERMRKMCKPIMDQLDWAFQLNRGDLGRSGGGGFVTVEEL
uniref:Uncharacterized protein n=1 Tax=Attheya septentrionalis TaxID=420275 RepID=A0A7S2URI8_9STRA